VCTYVKNTENESNTNTSGYSVGYTGLLIIFAIVDLSFAATALKIRKKHRVRKTTVSIYFSLN
jgi:hypothetical protein